MTATDEVKEYILPRHGSESKRLNLQHEAYVVNTGYILHPRIASSISGLKESHVADIATGTGAWLLDLEASLSASSKWRFTGLDISADQFPGPEANSKCQWSTLDLRKPIPSEMKEMFDVVHIRMLVGGLTTPDWNNVSRNVYDLLKPGGWIQWHEIDVPSLQVFPGAKNPFAETKASEKLLHGVIKGFNSLGRFLPEDMQLFEGRVEGAGFGGLEVHRFSNDRVPAMRGQIGLAMCEATGAALRFGVKGGMDAGMTLEEAEQVSAESLDELRDDKAYWRWDMYVVTGQKPL